MAIYLVIVSQGENALTKYLPAEMGFMNLQGSFILLGVFLC